MNAYLRGLERAHANGHDLASLASVASFFVSRLDAAVDPLLEADGSPRALALRGTFAIASAKLADQECRSAFRGPRWGALRAAGARPQRLLWASTSTKDPRYCDVRYVEELIGPATVTTVPPQTLEAFAAHGKAEFASVCRDVGAARRHVAAHAELGIDLQAVTDELGRDGIARFASSAASTLRHVAAAIGRAAT